MSDREKRILDIAETIRNQNGVTISQLKTIFGVSSVTIRKDLEGLEKEGLIVRTFGGAIPVQSNDPQESFNVRSRLNRSGKQRIGLMAANLIQPMESVIIDAGTTALEIVRHLHRGMPLTIITPAVNVALEACVLPNVTVIVPGGGVLDHYTLSLEGNEAEESFARLHADKVFLGVRGIDLKHGLTDTDTRRIRLKQIMIQASQQAIVVADSSKFGKSSLLDIVPLENVQAIITDEEIDPLFVDALVKKGVQLHVARKLD